MKRLDENEEVRGQSSLSCLAVAVILLVLFVCWVS
jgi:hypothetical protein